MVAVDSLKASNRSVLTGIRFQRNTVASKSCLQSTEAAYGVEFTDFESENDPVAALAFGLSTPMPVLCGVLSNTNP